MSDIFMISRSTDTERALGNDQASAAHVVADWLCLAATPTFAILALLTAFGGGEPGILCATMQHASPPWLKLIWARRR